MDSYYGIEIEVKGEKVKESIRHYMVPKGYKMKPYTLYTNEEQGFSRPNVDTVSMDCLVQFDCIKQDSDPLFGTYRYDIYFIDFNTKSSILLGTLSISTILAEDLLNHKNLLEEFFKGQIYKFIYS